MTQAKRARDFAALHIPGDPLVLYNIWDAGSAKAVAEAGAKAVATGSWSVAAAKGYDDGEALPMKRLLHVATRIVATVDVPLSVDFEGAYATEPDAVATNVAKLVETGAIGFNFEDQVVGGEGLHAIDAQAARIRAARAVTDLPMFINARTDLFLKEKDQTKHAALMEEAKARAAAYAEAGASGFFAPGLYDPALIADLVSATSLPVNIIALPGAPDAKTLAECGVARISHGPMPYRTAMADLAERFKSR